jgi:hypothetical protein
MFYTIKVVKKLLRQKVANLVKKINRRIKRAKKVKAIKKNKRV